MDQYWKETKRKEISKHKQERSQLLKNALETKDVGRLRHEIQRYEKLGGFVFQETSRKRKAAVTNRFETL